MPISLRETALAAVAARLTSQISAAIVERARRSEVDTDNETLPRLVLTGGDLDADATLEALMVHYTLSFVVEGYARAATDLAAEQAQSALYAQVVAALAGWEPAVAGIGDMQEAGAEFALLSADAAARPAGQFAARFSLRLIAATGNPYAA